MNKYSLRFWCFGILLLFLFSCENHLETQDELTLKVDLVLLDSVQTSSPTVTTKVVKINNKYLIYAAGEGKFLTTYSVDSNQQFNTIDSTKITDKFGGIRGLTNTTIGNKNILIVGNKAENAVEVHQIDDDGKLQKISKTIDTDSTFLNQNITIELIKIGQKQFVFVGGLDTGLSSFELLKNGQLKHIQSIADDSTMFLNGIIGMTTLQINKKVFLFTGGFIDGGISSFQVFENGTFKNMDNVEDDDQLFLNGTFSLNSVSLNQKHFVLVSHRHKIHYPFYAKEKGLVYHGDGINVFRINKDGKFTLSSLLKDTETLKLKGATRIEIIKKENQAIVFIATRDEKSIQTAILNDQGILKPLQTYDVPAAVYNGMTIEQTDNQWFVLIGDYKWNWLYAYLLKSNNSL